MPTLSVLHGAISSGIANAINRPAVPASGQSPAIPARSFRVGYYETELETLWSPPHNGAVMIEMDAFEHREEREDGDVYTIDFAAIVCRGPKKRMQVRALALEVAQAISNNDWGLDGVGQAYAVSGDPDRYDFKPDDYEVYRVAWKQDILISIPEVEECERVFVGVDPDTGAEHEADYIELPHA